MKKKMSKDIIKRNCLIASIAHAIFTCKNPDWDFLQSWDNNNYSIQDAAGIRGTISFYEDFCIGCFRNDKSKPIKDFNAKISKFSEHIIKEFLQETSQYLLDDLNGKITPVISSLFYCDNKYIEILSSINSIKKNGMSICLPLFERNLEKSVHYWGDEFNLTSEDVELLIRILNIKTNNFNEKMQLNSSEDLSLVKSKINKKAIQTFRELNIYIN